MKILKAQGSSWISLEHKWKTDSDFVFHTSTVRLVVHEKVRKGDQGRLVMWYM